MPTISQTRTTLRTHAVEQFIDDGGGSPGDGGDVLDLQVPNEDFTPPENKPWVSMFIQPTTRGQADFGNTKVRKRLRGLVKFLVNVPQGKGDKASGELVDRILSAFENKNLSGVVLETGQPDTERPSGKYSMTPVTIPFYSDDFN